MFQGLAAGGRPLKEAVLDPLQMPADILRDHRNVRPKPTLQIIDLVDLLMLLADTDKDTVDVLGMIPDRSSMFVGVVDLGMKRVHEQAVPDAGNQTGFGSENMLHDSPLVLLC